MTRFRALLLLGAALVSGVAVTATVSDHAFLLSEEAVAQPSVHVPLPAGLLQKGNTITMAPIADSNAGVAIGAERRPGLTRVLALADRNLLLRAFEAAEHSDWAAARALAAQMA